MLHCYVKNELDTAVNQLSWVSVEELEEFFKKSKSKSLSKVYKQIITAN